jgi:hypothetical protein
MDDDKYSTVPVECYAGWRGEETPRRFGTPDARIEVAEVVDMWLAPEHRYFKVRDRDGGHYILRHGITKDYWELRFSESCRRSGG